jgi:hypothetical protein
VSTRRAFLGTLGKLLGAGGVLLPVAGKGALALPADLGKAAALPVVPTPLPVSPQLLQLREIRRELHDIYMWGGTSEARCAAWRHVMQTRPKPIVAEIVGRRKATWADCVEIAEIALWRMHRLGPPDTDDLNYRLVRAVLSAGGISEIFVPEIGDMSIDETGEVTHGY